MKHISIGKSLICAGLLWAMGCFLVSCAGQIEKEETTADTSGDVIISGKVESKYTQRDLSGSWDESQAATVELTDSYTITTEGVYVFSGTLEDGQIVVDAADTDKVQIVLNGVHITCKDGPAILVENADKTFITLAEGTENMLEDGSVYASSEDQPWGTVFSKDTLTINGSGKLQVTGNYNNGIVSKDDLKITGGVIAVEAANDGLRGRDSVRIYDGTITIHASGDGIKANNDEDEGEGYVSVDGGEILISGTSSQGIDGYSVVQVTGGSLKITGNNEGIQSKIVYIQDGDIEIEVTDDCLNGADKNSQEKEAAQEGVSLEIAGGILSLSTTAGDGLDSNGDILISGGTTIIQGAAGSVEVPLDYNGEGTITGGTVLAAGSGQMGQNFGENSTQCSLLYSGQSYASGSQIRLLDESGQEVVAFTAERACNAILISSPELEQDETYTLAVGDEEVEITFSDLIMTQGNGIMNGEFGGKRNGTPGGTAGSPGSSGEGIPPEGDRW